MTTEHLKLKRIIVLIAILTSACSPEAPKTNMQVNNANCKPENVTAIKDKAAQQQLARACAHRGEFKPSEKRSW